MMFTETANVEELRQGDIIRGLYYPRLTCESLPLIGVPSPDAGHQVQALTLSASVRSEGGIDWLSAQVPVLRGYAMILSPCCDLELRNGKLLVPAIIVAPLVPIAYAILKSAEDMALFKKNSLENYTGLYYVAPQTPLDQDCMVDFCRLVSVQKGNYPFMRQHKVLQLTDTQRINLKTKLGLYFGRFTQEEIEAGLTPQVGGPE